MDTYKMMRKKHMIQFSSPNSRDHIPCTGIPRLITNNPLFTADNAGPIVITQRHFTARLSWMKMSRQTGDLTMNMWQQYWNLTLCVELMRASANKTDHRTRGVFSNALLAFFWYWSKYDWPWLLLSGAHSTAAFNVGSLSVCLRWKYF